MEVTAQAVIETTRDREDVFAYVCDPAKLPEFIRPLGVIPGVERAWVMGTAAIKKGTMRRVIDTGGTPLDEEVLEHEPPRKHRYKIKGFRGPLALVVKSIDSQWVLSPLGRGTRISWRYTLELATPIAFPAAYVLARGPLKAWMAASLGRVKSAVEAQA